MLCQCGCGETVDLSRGRPIKTFVHGHNARLPRGPYPPERCRNSRLSKKSCWTDEEEELLRAQYHLRQAKELCALLPRHSRSAIACKASKLRLAKCGDFDLPRDEKLRRWMQSRTGPAHPSWRGGPKASNKRARIRRRVWLAGHTRADNLIYWRVILRDRGFCGICHELIADPAEISFDHRVPIIRGGEHSEGNLQLAHQRCNSKKRDRLMP